MFIKLFSMKPLRIIVCYCLLAMWGVASEAAITQTVTIDGAVVSKSVESLTFDGDSVTVGFTDATTQIVEISSLTIEFAYSGSSSGDADGIRGIKMSSADGQTRVFTTGGQYVGTTTRGLKSGVYIVNGLKVIIK